jgi:hypothetical protein
MEQELLELLKAKFVGVSEQTLSRIAKKKAVAVSEKTELPAIVEGLTWDVVLQSEIDARLTEANKRAIENYEQRHGLKDGKLVKKDEPEDVPEWYKREQAERKAELERLNNELTSFKSAQQKSTLVAKVLEKVTPKVLPEFLEFYPINIDDETKVEEVANQAVAAFEKQKQAFINGKVIYDKPRGSDPGTVDPEMKDYLKEKFKTEEKT